MDNITKTKEYLVDLFEKSEFLKDKIDEKRYRLYHTYRVASIGKEIAIKENLNVDALVVGCLLHDVAYIYEMKTDLDRKSHGRLGASIVREFVYSLDLEEKLKEEILYGIATHVDGEADFKGESTILSETIGECDNIDRFDKYRLYEGLLYSNLQDLDLPEQLEFINKRIERLEFIKKEYIFKTQTSNQLWNDKLDYQINYYKGLKTQLETSDYNLI